MKKIKNELYGFEIMQGDCLMGLAEIERNSVDVVMTDPPYSSGGREATKSIKGTMTRSVGADDWFGSDSMSVSGFKALMRSCAMEWHRVLKPGGNILAFIDWRMLPHICEAIESADFLHRGILVWNKTYFGMGSHFRNQHEFIAHFSLGNPRKPHARNVGNVIDCKPVRSKEHPTVKPVPLLRKLLTVVAEPGDHVLDCFNGSGSTGVASILQGCTYTGIEREPRFVELTERRLLSLHEEDFAEL